MLVRTALAAALAVVLAVCAACSGDRDTPAGSGLVAGEPGLTRIAVADRTPAPVASGTDLDGKPLASDDFGDKVVVLNVWGSWCAPCRKEAPALVEAQQQTADVAQFVGINTRDLDTGPAQAFVRAFELNYPSIFDPSGAELLKFEELPPGAIPSTLVIDAEGRIAARIIGTTTTATLVGLVRDVAAGE
ncbi:MAG TPA: TlpA family protein disulfide reductase [Candidatus Avipropionibacterium avicola]|uniref:TlpA family protein disulfide reductase n=1 Tax=Candidatus Avipropionibacterium avicola TaxID=2840701 RepID=A0A9D1KM33_9ACTN|nr:TlpA family protein disulfide reductase [Candidatus Avipropionibacterium avicola]